MHLGVTINTEGIQHKGVSNKIDKEDKLFSFLIAP